MRQHRNKHKPALHRTLRDKAAQRPVTSTLGNEVMSHEASSPKVFISYSWEGEAHKDWVRSLSERLAQNGVNVRLDQWHIVPGQSLTQFMEAEVQTCEFVLIVCTKEYRRKSLARAGGVGYEQQIITGNIVAGKPREQFVPLVRDGEFDLAPNARFLPSSWACTQWICAMA